MLGYRVCFENCYIKNEMAIIFVFVTAELIKKQVGLVFEMNYFL